METRRGAKASGATRPASYDDLRAVPEHLVGEIIDGELIVSPRPCFDRGRGGPGGWWILDEPELHLGSQIVVPDLAGWRRERMPRLPEAAWFEIAPDWICEVLSSSTARFR